MKRLALCFLCLVSAVAQAQPTQHAPRKGNAKVTQRLHFALAEGQDGYTYCYPANARGEVFEDSQPVAPAICGAQPAQSYENQNGYYDRRRSEYPSTYPAGSYNSSTHNACPEGWANGYGHCCPPEQGLSPAGCF